MHRCTENHAPTRTEIDAAGQVYTLTQVQSMKAEGKVGTLNGFFHASSNIHLVRRAYADTAGWIGKPCKESITTAGGQTKVWDMMMFSVPLVKNDGSRVCLLATAMDQSTQQLDDINVNEAAEMFGVSTWQITRPTYQHPGGSHLPHCQGQAKQPQATEVKVRLRLTA